MSNLTPLPKFPHNTAGIIPVSGYRPTTSDFNFPWHECLMPINKNYLAIERSIVECAYSGCETIWIICDDSVQPLIRRRCGEWICDPSYYEQSSIRFKPQRKFIPIYYIPVHSKDKNKRDSYVWSIIWGALVAHDISNKLSHWLNPKRYYVSFPCAVYNPLVGYTRRREISDITRGFYGATQDNLTVKDSQYLPFTFTREDAIIAKNLVRNAKGKYTDTLDESLSKYPRELLPLEERWPARFFTLDKVFGDLDESVAKKVTLDYHFPIETWDRYIYYIKQPEEFKPTRPTIPMFFHTKNGIARDIK